MDAGNEYVSIDFFLLVMSVLLLIRLQSLIFLLQHFWTLSPNNLDLKVY